MSRTLCIGSQEKFSFGWKYNSTMCVCNEKYVFPARKRQEEDFFIAAGSLLEVRFLFHSVNTNSS